MSERGGRQDAGETAGLDAVAHLSLRFGRLLLASGLDTSGTVTRIEAFAARAGAAAELFVSSERLLLTARSGNAYRTRIGHQISGLGVDMGRLAALVSALDAIERGKLRIGDAGARLDAIEAAPAVHSGRVVVPAVALTVACLARLFGAEWTVVGAAFVAGLANTLLRRAFALRLNPIVAAFITALASGASGIVLLKTAPGADPTMCVAASGMILVPGVPLINGIEDLADGYPAMGLARLATGLIHVAGIGLGLVSAASLTGARLPVFAGPGSVSLSEDIIVSGVAVFGYAVLFNVPPRAIWACILCGMAGHGLRSALNTEMLDIADATLAASGAVGLIAIAAGWFLRLPWTTFAFAGVVAMIPGSYAFRAIAGGLSLMREGGAAEPALVAETLSLIIEVLVMTVAVGTGLLLTSALSRAWRAEGRVDRLAP